LLVYQVTIDTADVTVRHEKLVRSNDSK